MLASLGCGNPLAVADLHEGERVLDLGSGGGIDVLLSARRVGPSGYAYGVDMTDDMLPVLSRSPVPRAQRCLIRTSDGESGFQRSPRSAWKASTFTTCPIPATSSPPMRARILGNSWHGWATIVLAPR
jgi:hypothetical protein